MIYYSGKNKEELNETDIKSYQDNITCFTEDLEKIESEIKSREINKFI